MSQIVGTQAVLNVLSGRRWHIVPDEMKQYLRGKYGAAPGPVSQEVLARVLEGEEPIGVRPADLVDETLEDYRAEIGELARSEEDLLSYALFPQTARVYLERHHIGPESDVFGVHDQYLSSQPGAALLEQSADRVKDILGMIEESEVDEVVIEEGDLKITVRKAGVEPAAAAAPAAGRAAGFVRGRGRGDDDDSNGYHLVKSKWVATFYRSPSPQSPVVRRGGRRGRGRADALHPRDDEDDERADGRRRRRGPPDPRGERRDGAVRPAALRHRTRLRRGSSRLQRGGGRPQS